MTVELSLMQFACILHAEGGVLGYPKGELTVIEKALMEATIAHDFAAFPLHLIIDK